VDERKVATVLFADLVGSTELAGSQDPERTRAMLDRFYEAMAVEITDAGGTVEKFAGDAVMAAFGAPAAYEDHAERALHAALSMQRRLESTFVGALALRIGVNTGEVVVGQPREGSSFVTGDAVNVAARLEQAAEPGVVLVGERTAAATRGAFEFGQPMVVEAKGKPEGVPCRRLIRALSLMRPRGIHGLRRAFVGREHEFERLLGAYRATVAGGRPRLLTIVGDAGVGKSRLLRELWGRLAEEHPEPLRRTGRCLAYGRGITYRPLGEILREHLGIRESDAPPEILRRLEGREILGLTIGLDTAGDLHPLAARDRLHEALIAFLDTLVGDGPAVVLIEDIHWAEPELLDLIEQLVRDVRGPLFLVTTARPDFIDARAGWGAGRYDAETIWLEPLPAAKARELVDSVLGAALPPAARDLVVERAEGNPLFIEELLESLIDRGVIERDGERWSVGEIPGDLQIPDTVQAVVAARLDLLEPAEKAALQAAAVIGRVFWTAPVYDLIEETPDLRVAEDRDFIRRRAGSTLEGEREYAFKHAITREVAYESVPKARRARLHAAFAEWIERRMGGRDEDAPTLAHHFAAAVASHDADLAWGSEPDRLDGLRRHAIRWLLRAGQLAMSRYELMDAIDLFHQALELHPDRNEEVQLWRIIGRANAIRYDGVATWKALQKAIELCDEPSLLGELYAELSVETASRSGMWAHLPDRDMVQGWIDRALELAEPGTPARAKALVALCFWQTDRPAWAVEELDVLTRRLGDPWLRIEALNAAWLREFSIGRWHEGLDLVSRAYEVEADITDPNVSAELRETSIPLFTLTGHLDESRKLLRENEVFSERLSPHHRMHAVAMELELEEVTGDWQAVAELVPRTRAAVQENLATPCVRNSRSLLLCAAACAALGDEGGSRHLEEEADGLGAEGYESILSAPRIHLALNRGDLAAVAVLLQKPMFERRQMWFYAATVTSYLDGLAALRDVEGIEADAPQFLQPPSALEPFALRALGVARQDRSLLEHAASRFEAMRLGIQAARTRGLLP
jgi:class 3 adenylate cyclase